jgi:hypothetical protein
VVQQVVVQPIPKAEQAAHLFSQGLTLLLLPYLAVAVADQAQQPAQVTQGQGAGQGAVAPVAQEVEQALLARATTAEQAALAATTEEVAVVAPVQ